MAHKVLIIETAAGALLTTAVASAADLEFLGGPQLLSIYNTVPGRSTKRFAKRSVAIERTFSAIQNLAAVDLRTRPPVLYQVGDALPEEVSTPAASGSTPPVVARAEPVAPATSEELVEQVIPASRPAGRVGRPAKPTPARKLPDGTYTFAMEPRIQKAKPGGRRPELVEMLRRRPTFRQLLQRYKPQGDTDDKRAFNLATAMTCMGHVCGYGFRTAEDGRIDLLEPLES